MLSTKFVSRDFQDCRPNGISGAPDESMPTSNSTLRFFIDATCSNPRFLWTNHAAPDYTASDCALSVKAGMQLFSGGGVSQGAVQQLSSGATQTLPITGKYLSAVLPLTTLASGQYVDVYQWASVGAAIATGTVTVAGTTCTATAAIFAASMVGKLIHDGTSNRTITGYTSTTIVTLASTIAWTAQAISVSNRVPGTRIENGASPYSEHLEYGLNLSSVTDGTLNSPARVHPSNEYIFTPTVVGKTTSAVLGVIGHSLAEGQGAENRRGFGTIAAGILGIPYVVIGVGGSTASSLSTDSLDAAGMVTVIAYIHSINDVNGNGAGSVATFIAAHTAVIAANVKQLKSYTGAKVLYCTTGLNESTSPDYDDENICKAALDAWIRDGTNATAVGAVTGGTGLGCDGYSDLSSVLETAVGNNVPVSGVGGGIHWGQLGHELAGAKLAADITALGYHLPETADYDEKIFELFEGPAGTSGGAAFDASIGGTWTQSNYWGGTDAYANTYLRKNGTGGLSLVASQNMGLNWLLNSQSFTGVGTYTARIALSPQLNQTVNLIGPGFHFSTGGLVASNLKRVGYYIHLDRGVSGTGTGVVRITSTADNSPTYTVTTLHTNTLAGANVVAVNDVLRLEVDWSQDGTNTDITYRLYRGKTQIATATVSNDTTSGCQSGGYCGPFIYGNAANVPTNGQYFRFFQMAKYDPVTIGSITADRETMQMEPGMERQVQATVLDDADDPATGQTVTATWTGDTGGSITASAVTNASGVATFTLATTTAMEAGDTGTVEFEIGAFSDTIDVELVAINGLTGGGGGEGNMTVSSATREVAATSGAYVLLAQAGDVIEIQVAAGATGSTTKAMLRFKATLPGATEAGYVIQPEESGSIVYTLSGMNLYGRAFGSDVRFVLNGVMAALP